MSKIVEDLAAKIIKARDDYYNKQPTVSDAVFDSWIDQLSDLDPDHPAVTAIGAPVVQTEWKKVSHEIKLTSLNKVKTPEELIAWSKECNATKFLMCEKLDGISISTVWKDGKFVSAGTRGSGDIGEEIGTNVVRMKGVPRKLKTNFTGIIRGEIVLLKSDHQKHFKDYSNPRNAASGIAKRLDGGGCEHLTVLMYTVTSGKTFKTEEEQFKFLVDLGLKTPNYKSCNMSEAIELWHKYQKSTRDSLDYLIDGLVIRVEDINKQIDLGEKSHRPKGQIAFKFIADSTETIIRKITPQTGNSGRITPVAEFDEVEIDGVNVSRASLHNYSLVKSLGVDVGAKVIISRRNDVIPYCERVTVSTGTTAKSPSKCPVCDGATDFVGEYLVCTNKLKCPAQKIGRILIWINEQNILDWSEKTVEKLIDAGLVNDIGDLYRLKAKDIEKLDRMGPVLAKKLVAILDQHREIPLQNLLGGLGIEGVATTTSKLIIDAGFDTLDAIYALQRHQLESIQGFGSTRAEAFYRGVKENYDRIKDILAAGVKIKAKTMTSGKLTGKSFCFTGALSIKRTEAEKMVQDAGGTISGVSKNLTFLVISDPSSTSSKAEKARKLGTKCISEQEFLDMFN